MHNIALPKEFEDDLYEHTVQINGKDGFVQTLQLELGKWEDENYSEIKIVGAGIIECELEEVEYEFAGIFQFKGISIFETTKREIDDLIESKLNTERNRLNISYEDVRSGLSCQIKWD